MTDVKLRSLAPEYKEANHASYLRHLNEAVEDPQARNIALTGRYGSGKSSILDKFVEQQADKKRKTLRISINTLGPADDDDITNRIQRELVKQLVYRAEPGAVKRSRFARPKELSWRRALGEAGAFTVALVGLLWLFGIRASADSLGTGNLLFPTLAFALLVFGAALAARWIVGDHLVTQVSTGGTSIEFEKRPDSYLDEYLDEIVAFFEATEPDIVVFEDLDRFDDARIFDSLRELNTLINGSSHWSARVGRPVRFVYAIKDSLFEKLGEDQDDKDRGGTNDGHPDKANTPRAAPPSIAPTRPDAAVAETERANRTKFFEVVVPVVPFLSHSNARDLFGDVLRELELPQGTTISRQLLDLVAGHATDMRLMINIANEFVVYAEKLLWARSIAPGISADDLFALVVYKNFHLSDFESLPHRGSALDLLEGRRSLLIREEIARLQKERRELLHGDALRSQQAQVAEVLGNRLQTIVSGAQLRLRGISIGSEQVEIASIQLPSFWAKVAEAGGLVLTSVSAGGHPVTWTLEREHLEDIFSEGMDRLAWATDETEVVARKQAELNEEIAALRGAGFASLAADSRYHVGGETFSTVVQSNLTSKLARDLVRRGYITRYYAEYSSVFYGKYLGVDVANFFRNCIWPNEMQEQFPFDSPDSIANLLDQAPSGFTTSRSALNIQIVNYVLADRPQLAQEIVGFLVSETSSESIAFLDAFLNAEGALAVDLVASLAAFPWPGLIDYLTREESTPDPDSLSKLLNAALMNATQANDYTIGNAARELIVKLHAVLPVFTEEQTPERSRTFMSFLVKVQLVVPSLEPLSRGLRKHVLEARTYELTATNLRVALGLGSEEPLTLERIRRDANVWKHVAEAPSMYLEVAEHDSHTLHTTSTEDALRDIINEQHDSWPPEVLDALFRSSALNTSLSDISRVPETVWPMLGATRRVVPNALNLLAYIRSRGVDDGLTSVLVDDEDESVDIVDVETASAEAIQELTIAILNASARLTSEQRVALVLQLGDADGNFEIQVAAITPSEDDLLARLLDAGLVPDSAETFSHFSTAGWDSISEAFKFSENAHDFANSALVGSHAGELLRDEQTPTALKLKLLRELEAFAVSGGTDFLAASAAAAHDAGVPLTLPQLELVAPHVLDEQHLLRQLANMQDEGFDGMFAMRLMSMLGHGYRGFGENRGHSFDVPKSESLTTILNRLRHAGLVELPAGGRNDVRRVILA